MTWPEAFFGSVAIVSGMGCLTLLTIMIGLSSSKEE